MCTAFLFVFVASVVAGLLVFKYIVELASATPVTWVGCPVTQVSGNPGGLSLGWTLGGKSHLPKVWDTGEAKCT